jgi:hypothetical protein
MAQMRACLTPILHICRFALTLFLTMWQDAACVLQKSRDALFFFLFFFFFLSLYFTASAKFFCLDFASFLGKCPPQWRGVKGSARHAQAFFCAFYGPFNIAVLFILSKAHHSWGSGWGPFGPPNTPRQMPNGSSARRRGAGGEMVHDLYWFYTWD